MRMFGTAEQMQLQAQVSIFQSGIGDIGDSCQINSLRRPAMGLPAPADPLSCEN
jgi:hypothetical protein